MTENFLIMDITDPAHVRMVGEMDRFTVPMLLHENAIYLHEGVQYQVETLTLTPARPLSGGWRWTTTPTRTRTSARVCCQWMKALTTPPGAR